MKRLIVISFVLIMVVVLICGCEISDTNVQKVGEIDTSAVNGSASNDKTNANKTDENKTVYYVGETFTYKGLGITFVKSEEHESDNQFIQPEDGNKFIRLVFHVDNQSGSDQSVSSFDFSCYADGYECQSLYQDDELSASLSSGRTADGAVYFEIPNDAEKVEIEYSYNIFSDKKVVFVYEGNIDSGLTFEKNASVNENAFHVGDIIETKKLRITYVKSDVYESDNPFSQPADENQFIYIELEVENLSDEDQMISYISFKCYADGSQCDGFYGMDNDLSATLSSGRKAKGTVAFEVPVDAQNIEIEFEDNIWSEHKIVFLYE